MKNLIFVSWEEHRRSRGICERMGIELHVLVSRFRGVRRYLDLIPRTTALLFNKRRHVVVVQCPSLILTMLGILLRPLFGLRIVVDAHNEAVEPFLNPQGPVRWITRRMHGWADGVIVTNRYLADIVSANGGRPIVLADRVPEAPPAGADLPLRGPFNVVFVSTFATDEPLEAVLSAASTLGDEYQFYVTGNDKKLDPRVRQSAPSNVTFAGFLSEDDYWALLRSADLAMDLTLIDDCIVCGSYEAVAVGTPLVLSDNKASRELFDGAACFTDNTAGSIADAVVAARRNLVTLKSGALAAPPRMCAEWDDQAVSFQASLKALNTRAPEDVAALEPFRRDIARLNPEVPSLIRRSRR